MAQHGYGQRGVHRLVPAGKARKRQIELALLVTIVQLSCATIASHGPPRGSQGAHVVRSFANPTGDSGG